MRNAPHGLRHLDPWLQLLVLFGEVEKVWLYSHWRWNLSMYSLTLVPVDSRLSLKDVVAQLLAPAALPNACCQEFTRRDSIPLEP